MRASPPVLSKVIFKKCRGVGWESPNSTNLMDTTSQQIYICSMSWCTKELCENKTMSTFFFLTGKTSWWFANSNVPQQDSTWNNYIISVFSASICYIISWFWMWRYNTVVISTQQVQNTSKITKYCKANILLCACCMFYQQILGRPDQANDSLAWTCDRHQLQPVK